VSSTDGEAKFETLANGNHSYDASYIEITFVPTTAYLTLQFLFGSEEYNEYVYSGVSDAIGVWVNNTNIALTPEGKPISIDTINQSGTYTPSSGASAAPSLYVNNSSTYSTPMDGFTRTLGASIAVNAGVSNTIRIGVADVGDAAYDSWLLVKADSIQTSTVAFNDNVVTPVNTNVIIDVTANDFTDTGNPLTTIAIADQTAVVNTPITLASGATVTLQSDGTILYHPVTNSTANDLFGYTVSDGAGNTSTGYVNVAVGLTGPVVSSQTTTDTTPVISGTTSTGLALNSGEVMKVTVNGATYTVVPDSSGNWSVDLGSATPSSGSLTPLSTGTYDVTATVTHGTSVAVDNTHSELIIGSSAPVAPTVHSQNTNDTTPVITGTIGGGTALLSGEVLTVTVSGATYTVTPDSSGNWSVDLGAATPTSGTLTPLSNGTYSVTATVTNSGSTATSDSTSNELIIDTVAPAAPTVVSQTTNDTTPVITGTIGGGTTLGSGEVLTVTVSGATYTVTPDSSGNWSLDLGSATPTSGTLTPLANGTYVVTATVTDAAGNATSDGTSNELIIDTVAPASPTVVSQTTNDTTPIITGTIGGGTTLGSGEVLTVTVSGATYTVTPDSSGNWSLDLGTATPTSGTLTPLANGTYAVTATVTDAAGNATADGTSNELIIDTVAPAAPTVVSQTTNDTTPVITGTIGGGTTLGSGEVLTVTVSGATYTVTPDSSGNWSLDLGTATPTSGTLTPLANGTYAVTATVTDAAGNATADGTSNELIIDTVAPAAPTVVSQTTNDTTPVITGTIGGGTTLGSGEVLTVTVSGATYTVTPDSSGNWSLDLGTATPTSGTLTPLSNGAYPVTVTITDAAGNATADGTSNELIIDTVATTITSPSVNEASPYAVFTVTGSIGREVSLALANGSAAGSGTDFGSSTPSNLQYSLDNGTTWLDYASAITLTSTSFLVRTPLTNDATYEGAETFTLTATPSVGSAAVGTATIHDDGTGTIYNANGTVNTSATPDNDTPIVSMSSVTVSESSPYAVVQVSLSHPSTSAISFTPSLTSGTGTVGTDTGSGLEYFNGSAWVSAASGVTIAPGNSTVLLRTAIVADDIYEGLETISVSTGTLAGPVVSSNPINGTITIADDGSSSNVFNTDTNSTTPLAGEANNDLKSNDNDGVPESTESGLAQLAGSRTGDLNNDGIPDAQQSAVATLAWINNNNFENAITGKLDSVPTSAIISMMVTNANNGLDSNAQIENIQVTPSASLPMPLPANVSTTWDPISFATAPTGENGLIDADSTRPGTQQKILINITNAGLDKGAFNHYMVYISADTINSYAEAGKPLKDLDGNALTNTAQAGWYDFTARTPGGDGARYITENGKITGIEITSTDGAFGDVSAVNGEFSYYGVPVSAAATTVTSDSSITLADGIDNLMLNNVSKLAIPSTATCLPDWLAKMAGDAKQPVKTVANLNGTGNSWDNEITGNNGNNKLVGL
jgi:hypothetical protein